MDTNKREIKQLQRKKDFDSLSPNDQTIVIEWIEHAIKMHKRVRIFIEQINNKWKFASADTLKQSYFERYWNDGGTIWWDDPSELRSIFY